MADNCQLKTKVLSAHARIHECLANRFLLHNNLTVIFGFRQMCTDSCMQKPFIDKNFIREISTT